MTTRKIWQIERCSHTRKRARSLNKIKRGKHDEGDVNVIREKRKKVRKRNKERRETRMRVRDCMRRCAIVPQPAVRHCLGATVYLSVCTEPAEADRSARTSLPFLFNVYCLLFRHTSYTMVSEIFEVEKP